MIKSKIPIYLVIMLILIYIFPIYIVKSELYVITILSIPFIIYINLKYKYILNHKNKFSLLKLSILVYAIYVITITLYIDKTKILFSINKIIPLFLFIALSKYFSNNFDTKKILNIIMYTIIIICTLSIILYSFGFDGIALSMHPSILRGSYTIEAFKERRIMWAYEHKIAFGAMCMIGIYLIIISKLSKIKRIIFISVLIIGIILSNSKMSLIYVFILIFYNFIVYLFKVMKNVNILKAYIIVCFIIILGFIGYYISVDIFNNILQSRDISTLGGRTIIWNLVIDDIRRNPCGIIKAYGVFLDNGYSIFSTAHNIILNEMLETGFFGGILYLLIYIVSCFMINGQKNRIIFLAIFFIAQFDYLISGIFAYMFWFFMAILIVDSNRGCQFK